MNRGSVAVALVRSQVMVVQAVKSQNQRDRWLDVYTYAPFGERVFLASTVPRARIAPSDILTIYPASDTIHAPANGMLELPVQAYTEFMELSASNQKRYESLWSSWTAKLR
ncbi:hypothetical protein PLICRDRAFT_178158 [Plicaturopsis crispa FD-325 SS-3]|nr:hypothetical protein PLICRDRAFT_178158 [Plicaturopsis crispa FD-325 SS-3]